MPYPMLYPCRWKRFTQKDYIHSVYFFFNNCVRIDVYAHLWTLRVTTGQLLTFYTRYLSRITRV